MHDWIPFCLKGGDPGPVMSISRISSKEAACLALADATDLEELKQLCFTHVIFNGRRHQSQIHNFPFTSAYHPQHQQA
jgi:hypothetical protein